MQSKSKGLLVVLGLSVVLLVLLVSWFVGVQTNSEVNIQTGLAGQRAGAGPRIFGANNQTDNPPGAGLEAVAQVFCLPVFIGLIIAVLVVAILSALGLIGSGLDPS